MAVRLGASLVLFLYVVGCSSSDGRDSGPPTSRQDAIVSALADLGASDFSGVVLIASGGEVVVEAMGMSDREAQRPNRADTVFDIQSITKQFTAAAILRLEMDGLLSVDDPVGTYIEGLPEDKAAITLHRLLTHTAGLPEDLGGDYEPIDRRELLDRVGDTPLSSQPGTEYAYSNAGYSVLTAVIEIVSSRSYEAYLHETLFEPAGLTSTGYVLPDFDDRDVAVGYDGTHPVGRPNDQRWAQDGPYWNLRGNGGILTTARDMYRWHQALLGDQILDDAAKAKLYDRHTPEDDGAGTYYGYGWVIESTTEDGRLIAHDGGNDIFFADFLRFLDQEVTIFVATNDASTVDEDLAYDLADTVLRSDQSMLRRARLRELCSIESSGTSTNRPNETKNAPPEKTRRVGDPNTMAPAPRQTASTNAVGGSIAHHPSTPVAGPASCQAGPMARSSGSRPRSASGSTDGVDDSDCLDPLAGRLERARGRLGPTAWASDRS